MQIVVAKSATDPRWTKRNSLRARKAFFNPSQARDDRGRWVAGASIRLTDPKTGSSADVINEQRGHVLISGVKTPLAARGQGGADHLMSMVESHLDRNNLYARLVAAPGEPGIDPDRLKQLYAAHGFEDGRNPYLMNRAPKATSKIAAFKVAGFNKMSAGDADELDRLLRNADQISAKVRQAFLDAVNSLGDQIDISQIKSLLEQGRVDQAIQTVDAQLTAQGFQPVAQAITAAAVGAAQQSARAINALGQLNVSFGITNPQTVNFLRTYEMGLIRAMSQDALASVRTAIQAGVAAGRNPIDVARDVRQFIGLTDSQTQAVQNYRNALMQGSRDALSRQLRDRRFDSTVARAARGDIALSNEQIDNMVSRYAARYLKYRAETIARTESIRSLNAGNHQLWNQAAASGKVSANLITRKWVTVGDHKVRPSHAAIPGMNEGGVGLNVPFASPEGPILYPGDVNAPVSMVANCRCTVLYRFKLSSGAK